MVFSWNSLFRVLPVPLQTRSDPSLIVIQRFFLISEVLKQYANKSLEESDVIWSSRAAKKMSLQKISAVGLVDAKDVVFQDNPWEPLLRELQVMRPQSEVIVFAIEPQFMSLGSCKINRGWILNCYGLELANLVAAFPIVNAGTIFGTFQAIAEFILIFLIPMIMSCKNYQAADQAAIGVISALFSPTLGFNFDSADLILSSSSVRTFLEETKIINSYAEDSWICTVGYFSNIGLQLPQDSDGFITSLRNVSQRCRVLHHIDRFPWVLDLMNSKFQLRGPI
jgi:hypothetical protein